MKKISTRSSKVLSFSVISEKTRLKKSVKNWKMDLRERSGKESVYCQEIDYQVPDLDASIVSADDVPLESWRTIGFWVVLAQLIQVDTCERRWVHTAHKFQEPYRRPQFSPKKLDTLLFFHGVHLVERFAADELFSTHLKQGLVFFTRARDKLLAIG